MGHWGKAIVIALLFVQAAQADTNYPATFQSSLGPLSTLQEFQQRLTEELPEFQFSWNELANPTVHNQVSYPSQTLQLEGMIHGRRVRQTLTYIKQFTGLWRLLLVDGDSCEYRQIWREGEMVSDWICNDLYVPGSAVFADVFIAENAEINLALLSEEWGREVTLNLPEEPTEQVIAATPTLGSIREILLNNHFSWAVEEGAHWVSLSDPTQTEHPAIRIRVEGSLGEGERLWQTFLYAIEGDELRLKEIDGGHCRWVDRLEREICEPIYFPTSQTPLPLLMINSDEIVPLTQQASNVNEVSTPRLSCQWVANSYLEINRYHLERGVFTAFDQGPIQSALERMTSAVDPQNFLFSAQQRLDWQERFQSPTPPLMTTEEISVELEKIQNGDCSAFIDIAEQLHAQVLERAQPLGEVLRLAELHGLSTQALESSISQASPAAQTLWNTIKSFPQLPGFTQRGSLDIHLSQVQLYLQETLDILSDPEQVAVITLARQDAYTQVLRPSQAATLQTSLSGFSNRTYFGLSLIKGVSSYWVSSKHPNLQATGDIRTGDQVLSINSIASESLSAEQVDQILRNVHTPLELEIQNSQGSHSVVVTASNIDPLEMNYALTVSTQGQGAPFVTLRISSFVEGLTESIRPRLAQLLNQQRGLIIDLRGNPGGSAAEAARLLSLFVQNKPLGYYRMGSRLSANVQALEADPALFLSERIPMVVLIDRHTMSAAEIFASAIKDLQRGVLIGERSHGKLVGQNIFPLPGRENSNATHMLLVTTTEYYSPLGKSRNQLGVTPNVVLDGLAQTYRPVAFDGLSEGIDLENVAGFVPYGATPENLPNVGEVLALTLASAP